MEKIKKILFELAGWLVGFILLYVYGYKNGHETGVLAAKGAKKLVKYYKVLVTLAILDLIFVFIFILSPWSTSIGIGFIIGVIIFVLSWTPIALILAGVDKTSEIVFGKDDQKFKLFPPVFGTIIFWICSIALVATLYPKIITMLSLVISVLVASVFLSLWHSFGIKTNFQEWAMLVFIILMVVVYAAQKTFPRFYEELENRITSWGYKAHDQVKTPVSTKLDSKIFDAKDKVCQMEINACNARIDEILASMDTSKVDPSYLNSDTPKTKLKEIAEVEKKRDDLIKQRDEAKLSPTSLSTSTTPSSTSSSGSGVLSSSSRMAKTAGNFPRTIATVMAVVLSLLIVGGALFKKLTYSEMAGYLFIIGVAFLIAWNYFEPPPPLLPLLTETGHTLLPVAGVEWGDRKISINSVPSDLPLYYAEKGKRQLGDRVCAGIGGKPIGGYPLFVWVRNEDVNKLSPSCRRQLGIQIDPYGAITAPKGLKEVNYNTY